MALAEFCQLPLIEDLLADVSQSNWPGLWQMSSRSAICFLTKPLTGIIATSVDHDPRQITDKIAVETETVH